MRGAETMWLAVIIAAWIIGAHVESGLRTVAEAIDRHRKTLDQQNNEFRR